MQIILSLMKLLFITTHCRCFFFSFFSFFSFFFFFIFLICRVRDRMSRLGVGRREV